MPFTALYNWANFSSFAIDTQARSTVAGDTVDDLGGKAGGKSKGTMKLVSATCETRRLTVKNEKML